MYQLIDFIRSHPDFAQTIGVVGFMIYITTFFNVQSGNICGNGMLFPLLQVIAASCVLVSLASAYNLASFMIQTSYIAIGLFGIALRLRRVRANRRRPPDAAHTTALHRAAGLNRTPQFHLTPEFRSDRHKTAMRIRQSPAQSESPTSPALCP